MDPLITCRLSSFSINNFRVFGEPTHFELATITVLTGTNSSGKSSLTKALNLLIKSFQKYSLRKLDLMESSLKMGGFSSLINHDSNSQEIEFRIAFDVYGYLYVNGGCTNELYLKYEKNTLTHIQYTRNEKRMLEVVFDAVSGEMKNSFVDFDKNIITSTSLEKIANVVNKEDLVSIKQIILDNIQGNHAFHSYTDINNDNYIYHYKNFMYEILANVKLGIKASTKMAYVSLYHPDIDAESLYMIKKEIDLKLKDILPDNLQMMLSDDILNLRLIDFIDLEILGEYKLSLKELDEFFDSFIFIDGIRSRQEILCY
jgi:predicted ATPase